MALVVFLRGVNVGGHRTFRPSALAAQLSVYDVVNVGAAGTFVVYKAGSAAKFHAALRRKLPFEAEIILCEGRDILRLEQENPFGMEPMPPGTVRFVTILPKTPRGVPPFPVVFPPTGEWLVRLIEARGRFVFGVYRRHMRTIGCLGQADKLFGGKATTRNWNTILSILRILKSRQAAPPSPRPSSLPASGRKF